MSTHIRPLPRWMYPMLVSLPGFIIALTTWPTQTDSMARFLTGVLVGLSIASLIAGIVAYADTSNAQYAISGRGKTADLPITLTSGQ